MPHPSVTFEFSFPENNKKEVIEALEKAIIQLPNFNLGDEDEKSSQRLLSKKSDVSASFYTPNLKWLDVLNFTCTEETDSGCVFEATSSSTSVCCFCWSCCVPIRNLFSFVEAYSDHGQNKKHLEELVKKTKLKFEQKFIKKEGKSKTN
jgi:hypothetical protein